MPSEFQIGLSSALIVWVALLENRQRKEPNRPHLQREHCCPAPRARCNPCILPSGIGVVLACYKEWSSGVPWSQSFCWISAPGVLQSFAITRVGAAEDNKCQAKREGEMRGAQ